MYTLKGFYAFSPLVNNSPNQVALFGELSADSRTYAKDKPEYTDSTTQQTTFISFYSIEDGAVVELPDTVKMNVLKLGQWLYTRGATGQMPTNPTTLNQQVAAEFSATLSNFTCGTISASGTLKLPEWVSFNDLTVSGKTIEVTVWLSDASFSTQYPEYEIEVIPPIANLDDFFLDVTKVKALLAAYDITTKMDEVQVKRDAYPYTLIKGREYDYVNPKLATDTTKTYWLPLIYGQAGNNPDLIRQAIVDYVLANSSHTQEEWVTVLPDLFKTTEFVVVPLWPFYSVENADFQAGIYSPTVRPAQALALLQKAIKGTKYSAAWITAQYETSVVLYKSLAFGVVGNPDNKEGVTQFSDKFPDFFLVSNNTDDLNRMSPETAEFLTILLQLIVLAETFTQYSAVPVGKARVIRDGIVYITQYYDNVNYLVAAKPSVETL